jgi:hypothetical protein
MLIVRSLAGVPIRLTDERWQHIELRHPELAGRVQDVLDTVADPDLILEGAEDELLAARWFSRRRRGHYVIVASRELSATDGSAITAYSARRLPGGGVMLWQR